MRRRGRRSAQPRGGIIGFAWFTRDQWLILKLTADDREHLDDTYEEWLAEATQRFGELQAAGHDIRKLNVDVSELAQWCASRGVPLDGKSRSEFAAQKAQELMAGSNTRRRRA